MRAHRRRGGSNECSVELWPWRNHDGTVLWGVCICVCAYVRACVRVYLYVFVYASMYVNVYVYVDVYGACGRACVRGCVRACVWEWVRACEGGSVRWWEYD